MAARAAALLDMVFRRPPWAMGMAAECSLSRRAAAIAATLDPGLVTDLRRVMRWLALREPVRSEWELVRVWDDRPGSKAECCVNGLEDCCIS